LLKRQNLLIYAWMELKKRNKRVASLQGSRARSIYAPSAASAPPPPLHPQLHPPLHLANSKSHNRSTPKIVRKEMRLATEQCPANGEPFESFNKKEQGNRFTMTEKYTERNHPIRIDN
jgi:hypothetical protein